MRTPDPTRRTAWMGFGVLSSLGYGLWAFFDKLSASQNPFIVNFVIYFTALLLTAILILKPRRSPSISAIASGLFGGAANLLVLIGLVDNLLIVVYPFVAAGTLVYFMLTYAATRPIYKKIQLIGITAGLLLCFLGLVISSSALSSSAVAMQTSPLLVGISITAAVGFWIYFARRTILEEGYDPLTAGFWIFLASVLVSALGFLLTPAEMASLALSMSQLYPLLAGVSVFIGEISAYYAFIAIRGNATLAKSSTVTVLANSEIVPVVLLSFFLLHEFSVEPLMGILILTIGLILMNYAEERF